MLLEKTFVVGPLACNCRLLLCDVTGEGVLIDPGDEAKRLQKAIEARFIHEKPIVIKYLLHTHAHFDHIGASTVLSQITKAPISVHPADAPLYNALQAQGLRYGIKYDPPAPIELFLEEGQVVPFGQCTLKVLHTPGHSPGSVSFLVENAPYPVVYTGDTLFYENIGRADLWGGDESQLLHSIRKKLFCLNDTHRVAPGHGIDSTIGHEKRKNPFIS